MLTVVNINLSVLGINTLKTIRKALRDDMAEVRTYTSLRESDLNELLAEYQPNIDTLTNFSLKLMLSKKHNSLMLKSLVSSWELKFGLKSKIINEEEHLKLEEHTINI